MIWSELLVNRGLIQQCSSGRYALLPMCQRALDKLTGLVDRHMNTIQASKVTLPTLTPSELWHKTGRFDKCGSELMTVNNRHNKSFVLSPTHEEAVCHMLSISRTLGYSELPLRLYQTSTKFRDEAHPRLALLRGREFLMKDLYTFDTDKQSAAATYEAVTGAYNDLFASLGIPFHRVTGSCGDIGGELSHEFQYEANVGEDCLLLCKQCHTAHAKEYLAEQQQPLDSCPACGSEDVQPTTGIEVGHTFLLGTEYSSVLGAVYSDGTKTRPPLVMGCYGIGLSRLLQAALEVTLQSCPDNALVWPWHVAPYKLCIIGPKAGSKESVQGQPWVTSLAQHFSDTVPDLMGDVMVDDRDHLSIGDRVHQARLAGYPMVVVVGKAALEPRPRFELFDNTRRLQIVTGRPGLEQLAGHDMNKKGVLLSHSQLLDTVAQLCHLMDH